MAWSPTFSETRTSLYCICEVSQRALYELGVLRGESKENKEGTDEKLLRLVMDTSKVILDALPCRQLEDGAIEEANSLYGHVLATLDNAEET